MHPASIKKTTMNCRYNICTYEKYKYIYIYYLNNGEKFTLQGTGLKLIKNAKISIAIEN